MALPVDRWLEMDLTYFDPRRDWKPQIDTVLDRVAPLLQAVSGDRGIIFNVGWLIDLVTEWTGSPAQKLPTLSRRTALWAEQSYEALRNFIAQLREEAAQRELHDVQIGVLFVGWAHVVWPPELKIYDFDSAWYQRHPELYAPAKSLIGMPDLHPIKRLHADTYAYATFPNGLKEDGYFPDFFGAQWGHLADFLNLDVLHLRDGLTGPMIYTRNGPYGTSAPADPSIVEQFSQAVRDLYKAVKTANQAKRVFGYSSAISPIADWRVGCVDFEALVADGYIDGWIEQTWGGAWQDWWHQLWKGWTFQTANLLTRGAMIARANQQRETPCKFYNLIETWDGWEPWDTLHQVPHKLRWAMWAFTHAAVISPNGLHVPDGSYISWMNNGEMELLSEGDVEYLNTHLNMAQANALEMDRVYGWTLVYHRALMEWLSAHHPDWNVTEWIDDQAAMLMKWGLPILSITRGEWLAEAASNLDSLIVQTPGQLGENERALLRETSLPLLVTGRADVIDSQLLASIGVLAQAELLESEFYVTASEDAPPFDRPYLPDHTPIQVEPDAQTLYASRQTPLLVRSGSRAYWQPPDWSEPFNQFVPKYQLGSTYPHYRTALLLHDMAAEAGLSHVQGISRPETTAFHLWRSGGSIYLLLGNLETGEFGDSRWPRTVNIRLSRKQLGLETGDYQLQRVDFPDERPITSQMREKDWLDFRIEVPPEQGFVFRLEARPGGDIADQE